MASEDLADNAGQEENNVKTAAGIEIFYIFLYP